MYVCMFGGFRVDGVLLHTYIHIYKGGEHGVGGKYEWERFDFVRVSFILSFSRLVRSLLSHFFF